MTVAIPAIPDRRGVALIYATALIVVLLGFVGLAVDVGRAQYLKAQLQVLADVAARSAAKGIVDSTTLSKANAVAPYNAPSGGPSSFSAADVELGTWDAATKTFVVGATPSNAVRVTAARTSAGGNALPMLFLQLLGSSSADISAAAVAVGVSTTPAYGAFGSNNIRMRGSSMIDSYDSSAGAYSASWTPDRGNIASNGPLVIDPESSIRGDAYAGPNHKVLGGTVTGLRGSLESDVTYPDPSTSGYSSSNNDNANIPAAYRSGQDFSVTGNVTVSLPAGNYYFNSFSMTDGLLNVTGPATIYVNTIVFDNAARTSAHRPQNLRFVVHGGGNVTLNGSNGVYADIYAPSSLVQIDSDKHLYGRIVAHILHLAGNSGIHVDESLFAISNPGTGGPGGGAAIVQVVE
jgi:Flp pilus assembly protein TadG